jgi:PPOX class probable F420-dependent enzyme
MSAPRSTTTTRTCSSLRTISGGRLAPQERSDYGNYRRIYELESGRTPTIEPAVERTADLEALFPGRFLSVTSFKRDGTGVATPVWFVSDGERLFAFTDVRSAKVRRIRRNPRVLIASCLPGGKLRRETVAGRAEVLTATVDLERVRELLFAHYKISYRVVTLFYRLGRRLRGKQSVADGAALAITLE